MANKNFEIKNGLDVGNGLINAVAGDVSIRRGMSTTNRIRIASANIYADTNLTVAGNLTVQGDTTTLNVGTLDVEDKNITLNKGSGDTSGSANGAGITIQDAVDASNDATFLWNSSTNNFELSHGLRMDNNTHILLERGGELRSLDTSAATKTIARVNGSNELEFGWSSSGPVKFMGGGSYTERMRVHTNGNVGIGITSPMSQLHVNKDTTGHNTDGITLGKVEANGWIDTNEEMGRLSWAASYGSSFTPAIGAYISAKADANWNGTETPTRLGFFTAPEGSTTPAERLRITKDGNVGIGTTQPNAKFHVANAATEEYIFETTDNNTRSQLEVKSKDASGGAVQTRLSSMGDGPYGMLYTFTNDDLTFATNNAAPQMRLDTSGRLGLGATPITRLHIKGTGDMIRLESTNSGAGGAQMDMLHFSASPADGDTQAAINMGGYYSGSNSAYFAAIRCIGTNVGGKEGKLAFYTRDDSSFAQRFGITHTGVLETLMGVGSDNVALGNGALSNSNFNGDNVTAIGQNAGAAHTTGIRCTYVGNDAGDACTTGNDNTAIGQAALSTNITGGQNTAVGRAALNASTSGYNTAVGYHALVSQSTGAANTAVGAQTLDALDTGSNNTGVGFEAAGKMTSGYDNTAMGRAAMIDTTTGHSNTAIGVEALENNSSGSEIVAIGKHAGRNLTGNATTAIGFRAANNVTSSQESVYIGSDCAYSAGTGNRNVAVGNNAGYNWTSAYNNTNVGYNARSDEYNSYGSINLGYSVTGRGSTWVTFGHGSDYTAVAIGSTNWSSSSDERMKENIQASTAGLSFINDLRPVTFDFKMKKDIPNTLEAYEKDSEKRHNELNPLKKHGFVAQEVKTALDNHSEVLDGSEIWSESKDGTQGVSMIAMIPMLVKSIQELKAENDSLKTRIETLEG